MLLLDRLAPGFGHHAGFGHHGWWLGLVALIMWGALIGVAVWAVLRFTSHRRAEALAASMSTASGTRYDGALEAVRLRYARGEIDRDEFVQRSRDLGASPPPAAEAPPPQGSQE
jgi:putative membrane protein